MFKRVLGVQTRWFYGRELVNLIGACCLQEGLSLFVGGGASPFIDKGDGFTSERVRVRMVPGSIAHADGYKIMVGAYNTIGHRCRVPYACGRLCCLLQKW